MKKNITIDINSIPTQIEYSEGNLHVVGLMDEPFGAIKSGKKIIEIRANSDDRPFDYSIIKANHNLRFMNERTGKVIDTKVVRVSHYPNIKRLFEMEGTENTLSVPWTVAQGIELIHSFPGYKESIVKHGVYAIEIETT
ncbi:ASCH domain-containing protein [Photobacterium leiognathi]|uniref:ASCH domain-containing protein n=1 Tax=Photobacterium leiognathi TaxID=553611 RepID=UPI0027399528|nr:ASCH domain-containing protein [Photobacterium leiognathi]